MLQLAEGHEVSGGANPDGDTHFVCLTCHVSYGEQLRGCVWHYHAFVDGKDYTRKAEVIKALVDKGHYIIVD